MFSAFLDHDIAESVDLSVASKINGNYIIRTKTRFAFTLDMTVLLAQSLAMNATNSSALKQIEIMYSTLLSVSNDEHNELDQRLVSAFKQLNILESSNLNNKQGFNCTFFDKMEDHSHPFCPMHKIFWMAMSYDTHCIT